MILLFQMSALKTCQNVHLYTKEQESLDPDDLIMLKIPDSYTDTLVMKHPVYS